MKKADRTQNLIIGIVSILVGILIAAVVFLGVNQMRIQENIERLETDLATLIVLLDEDNALLFDGE